MMAALELGVRISFEEVKADEFQAMLVIAEERTSRIGRKQTGIARIC
jgi:hypothetical protein